VVIAASPERNPVGVSGREGYQRPRPRKLTVEERGTIRSDANSGRSLRSLAGAFSVSHETIRTVLRDRSSDTRVVAPGTVAQKR
jgi:Mor family transcriptional regulator